MSGLKIISVRDNPELRDLMASNWLRMQAANATAATDVPDNAPQNIYATVKVDGKVVATLYNGGSVDDDERRPRRWSEICKTLPV